MARMFPAAIHNFKNETEEQLYRLFKSQLPDEYYVFYGRSWPSHRPHGNPDPECDFIVAKLDGVILVIEAKGGRWERKAGVWYAYEEPVMPQDEPVEQARNNKYALLDLLKKSSRWATTYFPLDHAIALPETEFSQKTDVSDLPPVLKYSDLDSVYEWIEDAMEQGLQRNYPHACTQPMIDHLLDSLMHDYRIRLAEILDMDDHSLVTFTEQQLNLDKSFRRKKHLTVQGCAGSGKTLMAIRQVKRLAALPDVKRILFTCFNTELAGWLKNQTASISSKCETLAFHEFCFEKAKEAGLLNGKDGNIDGLQTKLPGLLLDAVNKLNIYYDAIVVDEGQSFDSDSWTALQMLLVDPLHSYFYVFYDEFQRIYQEEHHSVPGEADAFELNFNLRNTARIHRQAIKFLPKNNVPECNNVQGEPVEIGHYGDEIAMKNLLRRIVHRLVQEGGVSSKDIIILTPKGGNSWMKSERVGSIQLNPIESDDPSSIRYTAVRHFRGMERKAVILVELDNLVKDLEAVYYLGASRARTKLFILTSDKLEDTKRRTLAEGCKVIEA